jgi:hypothetical protein
MIVGMIRVTSAARRSRCAPIECSPTTTGGRSCEPTTPTRDRSSGSPSGRHDALVELCRYAAVADLQTVLGDHQAAVVAEVWLRNTAAAKPQARVAAGQLIAVERNQRAEIHDRWPAIWHAASARNLHRWL